LRSRDRVFHVSIFIVIGLRKGDSPREIAVENYESILTSAGKTQNVNVSRIAVEDALRDPNSNDLARKDPAVPYQIVEKIAEIDKRTWRGCATVNSRHADTSTNIG
jgi:hypothetical protein